MALAQSPNGVKTLAPAGAIKTTGTWGLGTRAGDFVYIAGMRGIDPKTNTLVPGDEARIRQGFLNMQTIAQSEGASLRDCVRIVVYVTDMFRFRPLVNKVARGAFGQVVQILDHLGVSYKGLNVLESDDLREGIKSYSNWPTVPQLYVKGEFVGGCDIVREMFQAGELQGLFKDKGVPVSERAST